MSRQFDQTFTIHPVGQGLFYSATIRHQNQVKFRMVYDCGSLTKQEGKHEVELYRNNGDFVKEQMLDLLVISHFDADHVKYIGELLAGDIKVKRLVMPLIELPERLFLLARYLDGNQRDPDDGFFVRFVIDPIGTLSGNLDEGSQIFLIESGNNPIPLTQEDITEGTDDQRFVFDFPKNQKEKSKASDIQSTVAGVRVFKVNDSTKGKVSTNTQVAVMDFLFYRLKIEDQEVDFFRLLQRLFFKEYSIDADAPLEKILPEIIKVISGFGSAAEVRKIFKAAEAESDSGIYKGIKIEDLNTTALCMLHRNLADVFDFLKYTDPIFDYYYSAEFSTKYIQKFMSAKPARVETLKSNYHPHYYHSLRYDSDKGHLFNFPNVLLTSDSFLLSPKQVNEFVNHYQNYWNDYWLIQIPHHGSEKSSNRHFHSHIPAKSDCFINFGINNRDQHPSANVIHDLVATGNSTKLISVNEYQGITFSLNL